MKKRLLVMFCVMVMVVSVLAACSQSGNNESGNTEEKATETPAAPAAETAATKEAPPEPVTLRFAWWGGESRNAATVEALKLFNEKYPHITVEPEYTSDGYNERLLTQLAGGQGPDLAQLSYTLLSEFVYNEQVQPINEFIDSGVLRTDKLDKALIEQYKLNDQYYSMPSGINTAVLVYNKEMFDAKGIAYPDETWNLDKYIEVSKEFIQDTNNDGKTDVWGTGNVLQDKVELMFIKYLYDNGGRLWSEDGKSSAFNSPAGLQTLTYFKSLIDEKVFPDPELTASNPKGVTDFHVQRVAMSVVDASAVDSITSTVEFEFGVVRAPAGNNKNIFWYQPSQLYVITKDSEHPVETAMLMDFILNDPDAGKILGTQRGIPTNSDIRNQLANDLSESMQQTYDVVNITGQYTGDVEMEIYYPGTTAFLTELTTQLDMLMYGKVSPQEMLDNLEKATNKSIDNYYE